MILSAFIKRNVLIGTFLFVFPGLVVSAEPGKPTGHLSAPRVDIVRKALDLFEMTVPTDDGEQKFGLTVFDIQEQEIFDMVDHPGGVTYFDQSSRAQLRRALLDTVRDWWDLHLAGGDLSTLTPGFLETLHRDHSFYVGRNTILVLSDPDDFTNIFAMVRIAKPSLLNPKLPVQRQFKDKLKPLPYSPLKRRHDNTVEIYSHLHEIPYGIRIQNGLVYEGDIIELKHYGAVRRKDVDLTAVLFHAAQEQAMFAISRMEQGEKLDLPRGNIIITPRFIVAESDNPGVLALLDGAKFEVHQTFPGVIHPEQETKIMWGTAESLNIHFRTISTSRRNAKHLPHITIEPREQAAFVRRFLACDSNVARSMEKLHVAAQEKLARVLRALNLR